MNCLPETLIAAKPRSIPFPERFRGFKHRRVVLNVLRAIHILCLSILVGGFFFEQHETMLQPWFVGTLLSGLGLFAIDLYGSCIALFEVRGISVLLKLGVLALLPLFESESQLFLFIALIIFSSLISHGTRRLRHWNFMSKDFQDRYGIRE